MYTTWYISISGGTPKHPKMIVFWQAKQQQFWGHITSIQSWNLHYRWRTHLNQQDFFILNSLQLSSDSYHDSAILPSWHPQFLLVIASSCCCCQIQQWGISGSTKRHGGTVPGAQVVKVSWWRADRLGRPAPVTAACRVWLRSASAKLEISGEQNAWWWAKWWWLLLLVVAVVDCCCVWWLMMINNRYPDWRGYNFIKQRFY